MTWPSWSLYAKLSLLDRDIGPDIFDESKPHECPYRLNPKTCTCSSCTQAKKVAYSKRLLAEEEAVNLGFSRNQQRDGSTFGSMSAPEPPPPPQESPREKQDRQRRERYKESERVWAQVQANEAERKALAKENTISDAAMNAVHYVGGVTKSVGDNVTGGVEALIDEPSMIADAAENIASTLVDGITYFPDAIVSAIAPDLSTGAKDRTNQRINNLADGISDSFEQAKDDLAKHNQALASGDFEGAGSIVGGYASSIVLPAKKVKVLGGVKAIRSSIDYDGHIINAEINRRGGVVGGHSLLGNVEILPDSEKIYVGDNGVYKVKIGIRDPNDPSKIISKNGFSTMFPEGWTEEKIKDEVEFAFQHRIEHGGVWEGITKSGVKVKGYLEPKTTVFPIE